MSDLDQVTRLKEQLEIALAALSEARQELARTLGRQDAWHDEFLRVQAERNKAVETLGDYGTSIHAYMMEIARLEAENKKLKEETHR